jgi:hypothetical protein
MRGRTACLVFSLRLKRAFPATWSARYHLTEETSRFIVSTGASSSTISWTEPEVAGRRSRPTALLTIYDVPWLRLRGEISECPTRHRTTNRSSRSVTCVS